MMADRMREPRFLGIEIGGTKLQLGIGDGAGRLLDLERRKVDLARGASEILEQIKDTYRSLKEKRALKEGDIRGVGVGFGGPVDVARGTIQTSYQVSGWTDFPLGVWLRQNLGTSPVVIHNDADTAGLAEARLGAGRGYSPLLYLTIGSGIGGALIVDGCIYRGAGLGAVEIGHLEVPCRIQSGEKIVQLEDVASGFGIARAAREKALGQLGRGRTDWIVLEQARGEPAEITTELVAQAAALGDPDAVEILGGAQRALAFALRQAIALLAPRRIVLGGGVSLIGQTHWFEPIQRFVESDVFPPFRGSFDIVPAALGEEVVVHGALALARDAFLSESRHSLRTVCDSSREDSSSNGGD
jgi:glucokinase